MFTPELVRSLRAYSLNRFFSDISAGVIVGIVALPLAIAFAIASGVSPERGLITAVVAGFLISVFGGSRVQIGGPTGAFVVIVYGIVQEFGISGLLVATFLAGVMLLIMGFARLGSVIRYIPHPVTVGFTSGIAVIIFSTQMRDFFGLPIVSLPADFAGQWKLYLQSIGSIHPVSLVMALLSTIALVVWPKLSHRIPGSIVVIVVATLVTVQFDLPVDTIGSRFGEIPSDLPRPFFFEINLDMVGRLLPSAFAIALLGAIESLLSAVVADGMTGSRHNPDAELVAQGIANLASPLFGGIPATGAIARTATNIKNGATSPVAGIVHAATLLGIMLLFGSYVKFIPMPVLASILVIVAYNMSEWRTFVGILKSPRSDVIVLIVTFLLTVVFNLILAIEVGMVLAVLLFIRRMAQVSQVRVLSQDSPVDEESETSDDPMDIKNRTVPPKTEVYEINGPFFFGTANIFANAVRISGDPPLVRILRMRRVPAIDATGIHMLKKFLGDSRREGIKVVLSGVHKQPLFALEKAGVLEELGEENIAENIDVALERAVAIMEQKSE